VLHFGSDTADCENLNDRFQRNKQKLRRKLRPILATIRGFMANKQIEKMLQGLNILVVDDNAYMRRLTRTN
jgi:hypothetical protein